MMKRPDRKSWRLVTLLWLCQMGKGLNMNRTTAEKCGAAHASCLFASYDEEFNCFDDLWHLEVNDIIAYNLEIMSYISETFVYYEGQNG